MAFCAYCAEFIFEVIALIALNARDREGTGMGRAGAAMPMQFDGREVQP